MRRIVALALLPTALADCRCEEPLHAVVPEIAIGHPDDDAFSVCATERVRDCAHDFHDVAVGQAKLLRFTIDNPSRTTLAVSAVTIDGPASFALDGDAAGVVAPDGRAVVTVRFAPDVEGPATARVVVASDAGNVEEDVVVELRGTGVVPLPAAAPVVVVRPDVCDFGAVGVGVQARCTLSIENAGDAPLIVSSLTFTDDTPADVFGRDALVLPAVVQPGTATSATFGALPPSTAEVRGTLIIATDDPAAAQVEVPFVVRGATTPTAVARVESIDGVAVTAASPPVEPLDDVVLTGVDSVAGEGGASITAWSWTIVEQPAESTVVLATPDAVATGFVFDSAAGEVAGLDVAGTFRVRLTVTDSLGGASANDAVVTLNAVPTGGVHVQLTWSTPSNDLDLHLGNGFNVNWCSQQDCYYGNCMDSGPNWDGVAGFTAGDPVLDIDDLQGFGPENIVLEEPVDGSYIVGVHSFSGQGQGPGFTPADATVKIYVGGALVQTFVKTFDAAGLFWRVGRVEVGDDVTITPVDTVVDGWDC